jgi:REP element-mobilizing transposase RayT
MSRLRRLELHSRLFFVTCNLRSDVRPFSNREHHNLAESFAATRAKVHFEFCGYCFLPDHWHAILLPDKCTSISEILMRVKTSAYQRMRKERRSHGSMWQSRFYDHILGTRHEFDTALAYIHQNPVRGGLVEDALDWEWSSAAWYTKRTGPIEMDDVRLPLNAWDRI